ncbi:hypothetical protein TNCV_2237171 [Trichonephila clavipes]|nr:hypothetical protein TNCV_2237171 [Trichonephila clavipes]
MRLLLVNEYGMLTRISVASEELCFGGEGFLTMESMVRKDRQSLVVFAGGICGIVLDRRKWNSLGENGRMARDFAEPRIEFLKSVLTRRIMFQLID